jgi:Cu(I)/Ag(I) efflux system membrane protein CusA/SilA
MTVNYITLDISSNNTVGYVNRSNAALQQRMTFPPGYTYQWIGQYKQIQLANARLKVVVPLILLTIFVLLLVATGHVLRVFGVLLTVPFGLVGAMWLLYFVHYLMSPAVWVGIIALAGLSVEMGLVLLLYLDVSFKQAADSGRLHTPRDVLAATFNGTVRRIRPQTMTVLAAMTGLLPLLWVSGAGAGVMRHLAVPMIGGLITTFFLELLVLPALYMVVMNYVVRRAEKQQLRPDHATPRANTGEKP